jgi:hypothetical protein
MIVHIKACFPVALVSSYFNHLTILILVVVHLYLHNNSSPFNNNNSTENNDDSSGVQAHHLSDTGVATPVIQHSMNFTLTVAAQSEGTTIEQTFKWTIGINKTFCNGRARRSMLFRMTAPS